MSFNGTILLVDDEPHIRKFVGLILKQLGAPRLLEAPIAPPWKRSRSFRIRLATQTSAASVTGARSLGSPSWK